ncbi:hypothetical protein APA_3965 [Pseudanabaena sp. lw0831]|nr:hypothetical protein APA_3965 [Pseudanabaena sp. lw0831]
MDGFTLFGSATENEEEVMSKVCLDTYCNYSNAIKKIRGALRPLFLCFV